MSNRQQERQEFRHALLSFIRSNEEAATESDVRNEQLERLLKQTEPEQIRELMEAADVAALLSGCLRIQPKNIVVECEAAKNFVQALLATEKGRLFFDKITDLIVWGRSEPDLKPYLLPNTSHGVTKHEEALEGAHHDQ
jgi:hypothetical protein